MLLQHLYIRNICFYCPPVEISRVAIDVSVVLQNCGIAIPSTISTEKYLVTSKQYKYMRLLSVFNLMLIWNVHRWQAFLWETSRKQRLYNVYARSIIKIRTDNMFCFCFCLTWEIWEDECYIVTGHVIALSTRHACEVASPQAAAPVLAFRKLRHQSSFLSSYWQSPRNFPWW